MRDSQSVPSGPDADGSGRDSADLIRLGRTNARAR